MFLWVLKYIEFYLKHYEIPQPSEFYLISYHNIADELDNENNIVLDVRPNPRLPSPQIAKKCHKGRRTVCTTKYHTGCPIVQPQH